MKISFKSENDVRWGDCKVLIHFLTFGVLMYNTVLNALQ